MINLITGVPGSGKSVYAMTLMLKAIEENRPLYVHGIPDLKIIHELVVCDSPSCAVCPQCPIEPASFDIVPLEVLSTYSEAEKQKYRVEHRAYIKLKRAYIREKIEYDNLKKADEWDQWAPNGALIFYDEVQNVYRPRSSSSKVPASVAAFETHRHKGLDFFLVTQSPLLFDGNVRRLVGRHIHLRPTWAGRYQYEFPECNDNPKNVSSGVKSVYKLNKKVFDLYKSSSLHTKQIKKIPFAFYLIFIVFFIFLFLGSRFLNRYDAVVNPKATEKEELIETQPVFTSEPSFTVNSSLKAVSFDKSELIDSQGAFYNYQFSIVLSYSLGDSLIYSFKALSPDGTFFSMTTEDLVNAGYFIRPLGDCSFIYIYKKSVNVAYCGNKSLPNRSDTSNLVADLQ